MLLSALTLAAMLQAAPMVDIPNAPPVQLPPPKIAKETPGARRLAAWQARSIRLAMCGQYGVQNAKGAPSQTPSTLQTLALRPTGKAKNLGEMPPAHGERAVIRMVDGCPVSAPIVQRAPAP